MQFGPWLLSDCDVEAKCYHLMARVWTQVMIACISFILVVNSFLMLRDEVLTKVKVNITYEAKMELSIVPVFCSNELLPLELISKAADHSSLNKGHLQLRVESKLSFL